MTIKAVTSSHKGDDRALVKWWLEGGNWKTQSKFYPCDTLSNRNTMCTVLGL